MNTEDHPIIRLMLIPETTEHRLSQVRQRVRISACHNLPLRVMSAEMNALDPGSEEPDLHNLDKKNCESCHGT